MEIHLVKHDKSGVGYAVRKSPNDTGDMYRWKVKFWQTIDRPVYFPSTCFKNGDLVDLGIVDDTEKLDLFS
jgi:hypothetical protein